MIKVIKSKSKRVSQGDIYKDVDFIEYIEEEKGGLIISKISFPLVFVLTQDCDLEQDFRFRFARGEKKNTQDKHLFSVLVAPLYNIEHFYTGDHLSELGMKMQTIERKKTQGDYIRKNNSPRYHYIEFPEESRIVPSVIDFKHYFSVNVKYLHQKRKSDFECKVADLFREDISQRFASYLSRIGLPDMRTKTNNG